MPPPDAGWITWLNQVGLPITILLLIAVSVFWIVRGLWAWGHPWLDKWIEAGVKAKEAEADRHRSVAESLKTLVEKTIEIHQSQSKDIAEIKNGIPNVCKYKK